MIILEYAKKYHRAILRSCADALYDGKVVAYPTDTSYGLAVDATNLQAIKKLYRVKERKGNQPIHVIVPSIAYAKKNAVWNKNARKLAEKFWPGPLTMILGLRAKGIELRVLSAGTGTIGVRYPDHKIALGLAKSLKRPITTTSANPSGLLSGGYDSYSATDIIKQFKKKKFQPDIIINMGKLPKRKPSTMVRIVSSKIEILRHGPITEKQIDKALK